MDKVKVVKAQLRLQQWAERISECQASCMTVAAWCHAHDINVKTYYYWLRKVREATVENLPVSAMHMPAEVIRSLRTSKNLRFSLHFLACRQL
ncbi:MAG: hypothetical protein PUG10_01230 [Lachnospiraceae bacterium]|nr:hypothetical protein [Lachnospiraceae bacterium]